jgi:hypothetical protein
MIGLIRILKKRGQGSVSPSSWKLFDGQPWIIIYFTNRCGAWTYFPWMKSLWKHIASS